MEYEIVLTELAKKQLDQIIYYILFELKNEQAALQVLKDAENCQLRLSRTAGSLKLCDNPKLRSLGYRILHFKHHRYFMNF